MGNNKRPIKILHENPLSRYYLSLPSEIEQRVFRARATKKIGVHETTVARWIRGQTVPTKLVAIALGEITGIAPSELYPELFILDNIINNQ